jgi:hypothetical protein
MVRPFFEWQVGGSGLVEPMRPDDKAELLAMVRRHEGLESERLAAHWIQRQPEAVLVLRGPERQPEGFLMLLQLQGIAPEARKLDPAIRTAWEYLERHAPLRTGERATYFRFWLSRETYQQVSPNQSLIFIQMVRHYLSTPGLAYTFIPCAEADFWLPMFSYGDLQLLPELDFSVGNHKYGVYGHDWRVMPPLAWLDLMAERENSIAPQAVTSPRAVETVIVLSQQDFSQAVREALRNYVYPNKLSGSPLLRSRLVVLDRGLHLSERERVENLQNIIREALESLRASSRTEKFYRALDLTYFHPLATQEDAAEALDLPFSTYRRHLKTGIDLLTEVLWQREVGG